MTRVAILEMGVLRHAEVNATQHTTSKDTTWSPEDVRGEYLAEILFETGYLSKSKVDDKVVYGLTPKARVAVDQKILS